MRIIFAQTGDSEFFHINISRNGCLRHRADNGLKVKVVIVTKV